MTSRVSTIRAKHARVDHAAGAASYSAKSIVAFLALLATNLVNEVVTTGTPWPVDWQGWLTLLVTTLGGTMMVWYKTNGPKPREVAAHSRDYAHDDKPPPHPPLPAE